MLRRTVTCRYDQFREAQRPVEAAFTIANPQLRLNALKTVVRACVLKPAVSGANDLKRNPKDANALLLATMSFCRAKGGWREALEVATVAHQQYALPLKKEWIPMCLEGARTLDERQKVLEGLSGLYGALPAELYSRSSADIPKLLFSKHAEAQRRVGGGVRGQQQGLPSSTSTSGAVAGVSDLIGAPVTGDSMALAAAGGDIGGQSLGDMLTATITATPSAVALAPLSAIVPASGSQTHATAAAIAGAGDYLQTAPQTLASLPTVNPSFVTYLSRQRIVRTPAEAHMMVAALTGRPMTGLVGAFGAGPQARALAMATTGRNGELDPHVQQTLFMKRPIVVRINRANPLWRGVRELLRRQTPFLSPLPWYPEELAWVVVNRDISEVAKDTSHAAGKGSTMDAAKMRKLRAAQMSRLRHLLQTLVDEGLLSFQSAASMMPAMALCGHMATAASSASASDSFKVLDLCAAPGGKTQQLIDLLAAQQDTSSSPSSVAHSLASMPYRQTLIVANDADERRLRAMRGRLGNRDASVAFTHFSADAFPLPAEALGLRRSNSNSSNNNNNSGDGSRTASLEDALFDGVLLDAPCTGEGRMHRDAQGWRSWHPRNCLGFHRMQLRALRRAIAATRDGGVVVYSTCTMNPLENEAVIAAVVAEGIADVVPIPRQSSSSENGGGRKRNQYNNNGEEDAASKLDGAIPEQLAPFISRGLSNWGVPLPNGEYTRPVDHSANGGEGGAHNFGKDENDEYASSSSFRIPRGIDATMLPPRSAALAQSIASACCRITPFPRYDGEGQPPSTQDPAAGRHLTQLESFFMCKLVVKLNPRQRAALAADLQQEEARQQREGVSGRGALFGRSQAPSAEDVFSFRNADKFTFISRNDVAMAASGSPSSQGLSSPTGVAGGRVDPHAVARQTLRRIAADFGVSPAELEAAAGAAMKTPDVRIAVRPMLESVVYSSASVGVYDLFAMSPSLAGFLCSEWVAPDAASSAAAASGSGQHHHHSIHYQTSKQTASPDAQQLLSPGACLFHAVVRRDLRVSIGGRNGGVSPPKALVMPTEAGAAAIAAATREGGGGKNNSSSQRVLDVPVEFLQHLMAMRQPIPEAVLNQSQAEGSSSSHGGEQEFVPQTADDALLLLNGLLSRHASSSAAAAAGHSASRGKSGGVSVALSSDRPLPFPAMVVGANTFADPRYRMVRRMKGTEGMKGRSLGRVGGTDGSAGEEAPWLTSLLGSADPATASDADAGPIAGPIVLHVRVSTSHRRAGKSSGYGGAGSGDEMVIALPAIAVPAPRPPVPQREAVSASRKKVGLDLAKLQQLGAPGSSVGGTESAEERYQQQLERYASARQTFVALTCEPSTLTQLAALLQRVLGAAVTLDDAAARALMLPTDRLTGAGMAAAALSTTARLPHLAAGGSEAWDAHGNRYAPGFGDSGAPEDEMLLDDASVRPLFEPSAAPPAIKAARRHIASLEEGGAEKKDGGSQRRIAAPLQELAF